ncbi:MAG TPA: hypothetical protein VL981_08420 [Candidatus Methylacidiphilales bacterium]|nr:hypothetical protein [Candidatus Methylacidiphilales bacterium]
MAGAQSLEEIIRLECLPLRDCMLTVTDSNGEAAFLYFKEGELIEANYAALWGKDALAQIVTWKLLERTVAPLPLGIKRSLWDRLEFLLNPSLVPTPSGKMPVLPSFRAQKTSSSSPFDRFKAVASLHKLVHLEKNKQTIIHDAGAEKGDSENTDWLGEFAASVKAVGDTLGFGNCDKWTVDTEKYQVVGLRHDESFIALVRRKDAVQNDLELDVQTILDGM